MHYVNPHRQLVLFRCDAPAAGQIYLVGDFNRWRGGYMPMRFEEAARPAGLHQGMRQ